MPKKKSNKDYTIINLVIPKEWKELIERLARERGYMSVSEFIRDLLRRELGIQ